MMMLSNPKTALPGQTYEIQTACGPIYVTITHDADGNTPQGLMLRFGKSGGCGAAFASGLASVVTSALRSGMEPSLISRDLGGIICHQGKNTCMDAIAQAFCEELGLSGYDDMTAAVVQVEEEEWG
jgi:ribonucleoside-diphosphate reductase alpha chain